MVSLVRLQFPLVRQVRARKERFILVCVDVHASVDGFDSGSRYLSEKERFIPVCVDVHASVDGFDSSSR